ncbi:MAG: IMP dehydrogenase, partial [Allorhizobium sp.]
MNVLPALANFQAFLAEATERDFPFSGRILPIQTKELAMARIVMSATGAEALTFDDVLLQPGHSEVMPGQTNI